MSINVAINGFGRIGRLVLRASLNRNDINVVAINDMIDAEYMAYLLRYDSTHGQLNAHIQTDTKNLLINGSEIRISNFSSPQDCQWQSLNVDTVIESTGLFTTLDQPKAIYHLVPKKSSSVHLRRMHPCL